MGYVLAVIGGSGLYAMDGLSNVERVEITTPFGAPSAPVVRGHLDDTTLLFLPRHGEGHHIPPSAINYRANICALKKLGATHVVGVSAVGSMREHIAPGDVVVVDQFIDLTKHRASTFFDQGIAAHVMFADPICPLMATALASAADRAQARVHRGGTYVCIEGPQFSTRAESLLFRSWGVSVIGMTNMPEAKLAREAELPFATLALPTDYDCWHESEAPVTVEAVVKTLCHNVHLAKRILREIATDLPDPTRSPACHALENAILTAPRFITPQTRERLDWLIGPYLQS
ncbi:MAG: S-methyl-5'-thioadenosine phosphorylase [Polyangiaceae bacterium]|jgi:5'-methylthioadenosine phosphorylase|nr:S-methyl-5'-thioadenosine phosphorylase [Polyangiaceae bacterium]